MKHLMKWICVVLATVLLCFSLVSCTDEETEKKITTLATSNAALMVELTKLKTDDADLKASNAALNTKLEALAERIEAIEPTVKGYEEEGAACEKLLGEYTKELDALKEKIEDAKLAKVATISEEVTDHVAIRIKDHGTIIVKLAPDVAPITVANFQKLVSEDFYDGLTFHRIIRGFMIQGGDPEGTGMGGSKNTIKGEFSSNGVENNLSHKRGVISMARNSISMDSASSQFFICHMDSDFLDGDYAAFGEVVYGLTVVDSVAGVTTDSGDKPLTPVVIHWMQFVTMVENG